MVSTHLINISQIGSFPQVVVKIKNIWNHHLVIYNSISNNSPRRCSPHDLSVFLPKTLQAQWVHPDTFFQMLVIHLDRHANRNNDENFGGENIWGIQVAAGGRETFKQESNKKIQPLCWCVFVSSCVSYLLLESYLDSLVGGWATRLKNRLVELDHFLQGSGW